MISDSDRSNHATELLTDPTDDVPLGVAWKEAEAALPENYDTSHARFEFSAQGDGTWWVGLMGAWHQPVEAANGPTPAAALQALAARLRESKP